jgi:transglutaminase-like putative cysteine protease
MNVSAGGESALPPHHHEHSLLDDLIATVALALFSLAVAAGFARVFSGWDFFDNLAVIVLIGHGVGLAARRLQLPFWLAFPVQVLALAWLTGAMFFRSTYTLFLPTSDTWSLLRLELDLISERFATEVAPVAFQGGWDVLAALGMGAVIVLSDAFAFRAYARAESLVPGGVLFVFVAALGDDRNRIAVSVLLVAAGVVTTVILRSHHAPRRSATIGRERRTIAVVVPAALATALLVAAIAAAVGPRVPGANAEPIYETKGGRGGNVTEVLSPLVDIRSRLTNQSTRELVIVEASADSYWRSSALPRFDGRTWGLPERQLQRTDGALAVAPAGSVEIRQRITIAALGGSLLPAAADPIAASGSDELRWNSDASTLVKTGDELERGDVFDVVSAAPRFSADQLAAATSTDPGDPIYFELPSDFPTSVVETAVDVTAGTTSPYEAALALQNWMRSEFTYSIEVREGHSNNAIEVFLNDRIGYCEQFAGTYAAMMRALGVPARVAVGFTPGTDDGTGTYSVLGRNAHAWPEVWFDGLGWVPFEPTPGRGAPGSEQYTGIGAEQDDGPIDTDTAADADLQAAEPPAPDDAIPPPTLPGDTAPVTTVPDDAVPDLGDQDPAAATPAAGTPPSQPGGSVPWSLLLALVGLAGVLAFPALVRAVRRRTSREPGVEIQMLWARALRAVQDVGVTLAPDLTPGEAAAATASQFPTAARPMQALADSVTAATYGPNGADVLAANGTYGTTLLGNCSVWCKQIEKAVTDSVTPLERVRHHFTRWG